MSNGRVAEADAGVDQPAAAKSVSSACSSHGPGAPMSVDQPAAAGEGVP